MDVKVLPAHNGDCLLISFNDGNTIRNILIDGGIGKTGMLLMKELKLIEAKGQLIDLLIVTHIDDDHIGGIIKIFSKDDTAINIVKRVWFNSGTSLLEFFSISSPEERDVPLTDSERLEVSTKQGNTLENKLKNLGIWDKSVIYADATKRSIYGASIYVLSPSIANLEALNRKWETEISRPENVSSPRRDYDETVENLAKKALPAEDSAVPNGSSIALMIELNGLRSLYLADAHPATIVHALEHLGYSEEKPVKANLIKVSHHGSSHNINEKLLKIWDCNNYIISTNGAKHGLPSKQCLSKLISTSTPRVNLYFNYKEIGEQIFTEEDRTKYRFRTFDLSDEIFNYTINI